MAGKTGMPGHNISSPRMDSDLRFSRMAQEISSRMKKELGITVSAGVSFNKIFAKLGSDYKKPDAITTMYEDEFQRKALVSSSF